jgi:hypothetical protein
LKFNLEKIERFKNLFRGGQQRAQKIMGLGLIKNQTI